MIHTRIKTDSDGTVRYYNENGQLHREDGPAVEAGGIKGWYINGNLHRQDGPAVETDDYKGWYINDVNLTEAEFNAQRANDIALIDCSLAALGPVEWLKSTTSPKRGEVADALVMLLLHTTKGLFKTDAEGLAFIQDEMTIAAKRCQFKHMAT